MDKEQIVYVVGALVALAMIVGMPTACSVAASRTIERMVADGADPIASACAIRPSSMTETLCREVNELGN